MQAIKFEPITPAQIKILHVLYKQLGWDEDFKREQLRYLTNGRTGSTKELSKSHAKAIIEWANEKVGILNPKIGLRKKVFSICYKAGFIWGESTEDKAMNTAKIDRFLKERGSVKKELFEQSEQELKRTIRQFEAMFTHDRQTHANKATAALLSELNLFIQDKNS